MSLYKITKQKLYYLKYSKNTVKTYLHYVDEFELSLNKHYSRLCAKDIQEYLNNYVFTSVSQQNQIVNALKFAWEKSLGKKYLKIDFTRPRKEKKLPRIIDKNFILSRLGEIENKKHIAIIALGFSVGLRVSEVVNLKVKDIDSARMIIHIRNAKGRKDRLVPLSDGLLKILRDYYQEYHPTDYLFYGQSKPKYTASSCNKIVKKYLGNEYHFHLLRHSSFTCMHESGEDIATISKIAGHSSIKTTMIYTHVSNQSLRNTKTPI